MSSCLVGARLVSNLLVRPDWQETKKRKKSMQTKTNRRGLAIGAAIALVGTFFGAAPASYATTDGAYIDIRPLSNSDLSNFGGLLTEDFPIYAQLKSGTANQNANFANGKLMWQITRTSGEVNIFAAATNQGVTAAGDYTAAVSDSTVLTSTSVQVALGSFGVTATEITSNTNTVSNIATVSWTGSTAVTLAASVSPAGIAPLFLRALNSVSGTTTFTSVSPNVTFTVMAFIDDLGGQNGRYDSGEWFSTKTVTLYASSRLNPTVTLGSPARGDTVVTASATLTTLNWSNLNGVAFFQVNGASSTVPDFNGDPANTSSSTVSAALSGATLVERSGVVSRSFTVQHSATLSENVRLYGQLRYQAAGGSSAVDGGVLIGAASTSALVSFPGVTELSITASDGVNIVAGGASTLNIRPNQKHTIEVRASSGSGAVSVGAAVTVVLSGVSLATGSKMVSVNGGAMVGSLPTFTVNTATASGIGTFTLETTGFVSSDDLTVTANVGNVSTTATLDTQDAAWTITPSSNNYATTPGTAVNIAYTVKDQWGVLSSRTDHFLRITRAGSGFNYATTVSHVQVVNGLVTFAFTPAPATATGSATVGAQSTRLLTGAYVDVGSPVSVSVTVTTSALAFSTGLAVSRAATVSYFPSTISWATVTGSVVVPGSTITITGANMVFRVSADLPTTTSGTLTMNADSSGNYSFQVGALRIGDQTITLTTGAASTTSRIVVSTANSDQGSKIAWDTTAIDAGKTRVITGTLTDMNGNPVDTTGRGLNTYGDSGTASITITYQGTAGIVVGTVPTETDADGKFRISVLTSATDQGTLTLTAVYNPQGADTVAANKVTSVQAVAVAPAAPVEANAVIGSFNGRWAVRVENAKGSVVSVKAGNRWVKFSALNNNYLFSRKSVVGRTIAVSVWVDGELQNSQTITIK